MAKAKRMIRCPHCAGTGKVAVKDATIGTMILAARNAKHMTQQQLADRVELSRAQIANIEAGRSDIPLRTLARFAQAFKVPMRNLIPE